MSGERSRRGTPGGEALLLSQVVDVALAGDQFADDFADSFRTARASLPGQFLQFPHLRVILPFHIPLLR
jgi:hypothetical protein